MCKYDTCDFEREKVIKKCEEFDTATKQIDYLRCVLREYRNNPPSLDPNWRIKPTFDRFVEEEIEYRKLKLLKGKENKTEEKFDIEKIEQDMIIDKYRKLFERYNLEKKKYVPREVLYDIAKMAGTKVPEDINDFKSGEKSYQIARQFASVLGYKRPKRN